MYRFFKAYCSVFVFRPLCVMKVAYAKLDFHFYTSISYKTSYISSLSMYVSVFRKTSMFFKNVFNFSFKAHVLTVCVQFDV